MKQHFVTFCSPGTLFTETTEKPIPKWDVPLATSMAKDIKERHGAVPFGFFFTTRERKAEELDSREIARSEMYYLGGKVETLEEVKARATPADSILISNMEGNKIAKVITNTNSWRVTVPFNPGDILLAPEGE